MSGDDCVYSYSSECDCGRWGLNKVLCGLHKALEYISSLEFSVKNAAEVARMLMRIGEYPERLAALRWHACYKQVSSYFREISDGNGLLSLSLDTTIGQNEKSSRRNTAVKLKKEFEKLQGTIDKINPEIEYHLTEVDKIDGMVVQS
jgi:hypothetical protein